MAPYLADSTVPYFPPSTTPCTEYGAVLSSRLRDESTALYCPPNTAPYSQPSTAPCTEYGAVLSSRLRDEGTAPYCPPKYGDVLSVEYGAVNRVRRRTWRIVRRRTFRQVRRRTLVGRGHGAVLGRVESDVDRRPPDSLPRHRQTTSHARRLVRATSVHHALDICDSRASGRRNGTFLTTWNRGTPVRMRCTAWPIAATSLDSH